MGGTTQPTRNILVVAHARTWDGLVAAWGVAMLVIAFVTLVIKLIELGRR